MKNEVRPIDANALARRIREYMDDYPNATARLTACRAILSMLGDEGQTPTLHIDHFRDLTKMMPLTIEQLRETWEPCELCGGDKLDGVGFGDHFGLRIYLRGGNNIPPENERFQFCPKCGRPRTPEAWAELANRLRKPAKED